MSVAPLTADELGLFAACCVKLELLPMDRAVELASVISQGNCGAWAETYSDRIEPQSADEIERIALDRLAANDLSGAFGPLAYNMIANNGLAFVHAYGGSVPEESKGADLIRLIGDLEKKVYDYQKAESRRLQRAEEDAIAFDEVGRLATFPIEQIRDACAAAGCERIILATFNTNESDSQTDYFGGRETRRVVIGFGKGKRESFKQLRKAAAAFPPTSHLAPGRDQFTVCLAWDHNREDDPERSYMRFSKEWDPNQPSKDSAVVFHWYAADYSAPHGRWGYEFDNQEAVNAFIAANTPHRGTYWRVSRESYEHRENYSMGGGNYLGTGRYSGWQVYSYPADSLRNPLEWWQPVTASPVIADIKPEPSQSSPLLSIDLDAFLEAWL